MGIGIWIGSVAVISDAFHTFSAVGGVLIALVATRLTDRKSSPARTFGYLRAEILGALFNGLLLAAMALLVLWMGAMRLMEPIELATTPMLIAAAGGIATELVALWLLYKRQKDNLNMRGAYWHILQTFVGSFLIIISALVIGFTGFLAIDPLLGMAFGLVLLWASWGILRESLHILLQGTPEDLDLAAAIAAIRELEGVTDVHHVHAWSLTSGVNVFSSHVCGWRLARRRARAAPGQRPFARSIQRVFLNDPDRGILPRRRGGSCRDRHHPTVHQKSDRSHEKIPHRRAQKVVTTSTRTKPRRETSMGEGKNDPAEVYERYLGRAIADPFTRVLLEHASPAVGDRVLDLAAGTGSVARHLAPLVGTQGCLVAVDVNPHAPR